MCPTSSTILSWKMLFASITTVSAFAISCSVCEGVNWARMDATIASLHVPSDAQCVPWVLGRVLLYLLVRVQIRRGPNCCPEQGPERKGNGAGSGDSDNFIRQPIEGSSRRVDPLYLPRNA
ncbi:hypothetical protein H4582DRAFT_2007449 [Lactarius indigo]|nr:hypothetical protein H4582DRAFT_2007449 [Lactarius indigo]